MGPTPTQIVYMYDKFNIDYLQDSAQEFFFSNNTLDYAFIDNLDFVYIYDMFNMDCLQVSAEELSFQTTL